jgi:hypothetical protein
MIADGLLQRAPDFYHAAMILQHGHADGDHALAARLAERAVALDPGFGEARWLAAAAHDRERKTRGTPQRYGTQYDYVDGRWVLWEVDPTVTDEERAEWNVPSLEEARRHARRWNEP